MITARRRDFYLGADRVSIPICKDGFEYRETINFFNKAAKRTTNYHIATFKFAPLKSHGRTFVPEFLPSHNSQ